MAATSSVNTTALQGGGLDPRLIENGGVTAGKTSAGSTGKTSTGLTAGAGINGAATTTVPEATETSSSSTTLTWTYQSIMVTLEKMMPGAQEANEASIKIQQTAEEIDKVVKSGLEEDIKNKTSEQRDNIQESQKKMDEAHKAQKKARKKRRTAGLFSKITNYVSASLMIAGGIAIAVMAAPTGIGVAGGVMMAMAGAAMLSDQITQDKTGKGFAQRSSETFGGDAQSWAIAYAVTFAVVGAAGGGVGVVSLGSAAAKTAAAGIGAASSLTTGSLQAASTVKTHEADVAQVEATKTHAGAKQFDAQMRAAQVFLDIAMEVLKNTSKQISSLLDISAEILQEQAQTIGQVSKNMTA